jgi:hypothetical protein
MGEKRDIPALFDFSPAYLQIMGEGPLQGLHLAVIETYPAAELGHDSGSVNVNALQAKVQKPI